MPNLTRREWFHWSAVGLAALSLRTGDATAAREGPGRGCTLSIGTYSMKGMALEKAIPAVAAIGYDGIEIAVQRGHDGEPERMPPQRRQDVRRLLGDKRLQLTALMEHLPPATDDAQHKADLQRLRRVTELARDLAPDRPPLVQTVLGNGTWQEKKNLFRDRLGEWLAIFGEAKVVLAIKPHRGGALSRPEEAVWLIRQLQGPALLRLVYDYSHYAFRDLPLEETVRTLLPFTAHVAVKDAVQKGGRVEFVLPGGSGSFDYARLLRLLYGGGYRGDVCCEVSSMVSSQPGYDPLQAAKTCHRNMARAFEKANVPRGSGM
jgi:sugar phosphate isomerase/epimerase